MAEPDSDEDVVFENSPLYEHLRNVGFSTEDVKPETKCSSEKNAEEIEELVAGSNKYRGTTTSKTSKFQRLKAQLEEYLFDEVWQSQICHLYAKSSRHLVEDVVKTTAVCEEDAAYIESFGSSLDCNQREEVGDGIMGQMLTQIGVLTVTMAYGFVRMFYMKQPDFAAGAYVYMLDALSVFMTIVALAPAALKFAMIGRIVNQLQSFNMGAAEMLRLCNNFERTLSKTLLFIQEVEVIQRGFTLVTAPVSRLELGILKGSERQCAELRRVIFHRARKVLLLVKSATSDLLKHLGFPSHIELEGLSSYLANIPMEEYGPPINVPEDQKERLNQATDDYCLGSLKAISHIVTVQISEYLRVLCILCLIQADEPRRSKASGYVEQLKLVKNVETELNDSLRLLEKSYNLHKNLESKLASVQKRAEDSRLQAAESSSFKAVYQAVRSLRLHLHTTLQRIQAIDEQLENAVQGSQVEKPLIPDCVQSQLSTDLDYVRCQLTACRDCWEEADRRLVKLRGPSATQHDAPCVKDDTAVVENGVATTRQSVSVDCKPLVEDQVFEGYPDYNDQESIRASALLTEEEKRDQREALRVLSELKAVISVRARETVERERNALLRQNPDYKFIEEDYTWNDGKQESCVSEKHLKNVGSNGQQSEQSSASSRHECAGNERERCAEQTIIDSGAVDVPANGDYSFTKHVAMLAIAKSMQMASLPAETFGDDADSESCGGDSDHSDWDVDDGDNGNNCDAVN